MIDKKTGINPKELLGERIAALAARIDAATYQMLVLIREFDEKEGWNNGFRNCAHWLTWRIGLAPGAARERVRVAHALGELPRMSDAMKRGVLSYSKVRALTRIATAETEESLVDVGRCSTAAHIERLVRGWRRVDRSIEASDDELREASSHVSTHIDENGMFVIRGRLAPEAGEVLMKALDAAGEKLYASRDEAETTNQDDRPPAGKVRADALALVAESALKAGLDPGSSGDRYQVVVHVNEDELKAANVAPRVSAETPTSSNAAQAPAKASDDVRVSAQTSANGKATDASLSPERGVRLSAETSNGSAPSTRSTCIHAEDLPPAGAWLGASHIRVSAETARRIACDAGKVPMTHANGRILSVGRKTRTIPPPIRRALEFRDQGCRFPGCSSQHCDAHHIEHWADGGETKLSNLVLLCRRHHRLLHEGGYTVRTNAQGAVQFHHRRGRPLHECPSPPPMGPDPIRELIEGLEDAGILITGEESLPAWDGEPMDLPYVLECLWRPPPHLEAAVAQEREPSRAA